MVRIQEVIVVEGRYDKNTLSQIVDATIFPVNGFGVFKDRDTVALLRRAAATRGVVVLTDSDGAGFVIRNHLKSVLPGEKLLHAYIPDIAGKEKRKKQPSREGLLGVEGMTPEIILDALRRSGAHFLGEVPKSGSSITRQDLYRLGLMGGEGSAELRNQIKTALRLPAHLGTSGFLDALNLITDPEELERLVAKIWGGIPEDPPGNTAG